MMKVAIAVICILLAIFTAGCAAPGQYDGGGSALGEEEIRRGVITRIDPVSLEHSHQVGLGAILGAAAGGLVGNQFGRGSGRDVATILGAIGGGVLGDQVQQNYRPPLAGQHIFVQLANGVTTAITQPADANLRVGDQVFIEGRGQSARVVRR